MYAADGSVMAVLKAEENRKPVALSQIPQPMIDTVLAVEDAEFYHHRGVNARSLIRALLANVSAGGVTQGGSTITQQVVKNALLTPKRDANRKVKEAIYAVRLERTMTKDEILERYLNTVYFGNGAYGVQAAAELYFGTDVGSLDYPQAAFLTGLIRNPVGYDPFRFPARATDRRRRANPTGRRRQAHRDQADLIDATPIPATPQVSASAAPPEDYFVEEVKQQAARRCAASATPPKSGTTRSSGRLADLHDVRPEDAARGTAGPKRPAS
jgi:penicillin-binding protein 1A